MPSPSGRYTKAVGELDHGDETIDYGVVDHREGRKVWFEKTIVTFPSEADRVAVTADSSTDHDR